MFSENLDVLIVNALISFAPKFLIVSKIFLFISIIFFICIVCNFFKKSKDDMNNLAIFIVIFGSFGLLIDITILSNDNFSLSNSIYNFVAVLTLAFLIIFNNRIIKIQDEVKKIQSRETLIHEQELNLKLTPFLEKQNKEIYSPLVDFLNILKYSTSNNNQDFMILANVYDIDILKEEIGEILKHSEQMNQTDLKKINLINEIFENVFLQNINHSFDLKNQDEVNELKFRIINDFITTVSFNKDGLDSLDENLKKDIKKMRSTDLFKKENSEGREHIIFYPSDNNNLIFENGAIYMDQNKLLDYEKEKFKEKYTSEDLIPLLPKYFEKQYNHFRKIKMKIEQKLDDNLPYDVSKFADEN